MGKGGVGGGIRRVEKLEYVLLAFDHMLEL